MALGPSASEYVDDLLRLIAFLGRYGHQPASVVMRMPVTQVQRLSRHVADLLEEEKESAESLASGGD